MTWKSLAELKYGTLPDLGSEAGRARPATPCQGRGYDHSHRGGQQINNVRIPVTKLSERDKLLGLGDPQGPGVIGQDEEAVGYLTPLSGPGRP